MPRRSCTLEQKVLYLCLDSPKSACKRGEQKCVICKSGVGWAARLGCRLQGVMWCHAMLEQRCSKVQLAAMLHVLAQVLLSHPCTAAAATRAPQSLTTLTTGPRSDSQSPSTSRLSGFTSKCTTCASEGEGAALVRLMRTAGRVDSTHGDVAVRQPVHVLALRDGKAAVH